MEYDILKRIIAQVLMIDEDDIRPEHSFVNDLDADSLEIFKIIMKLEEEFDLEVDQERAASVVTVSDAVHLIRETLAN